MFNKVDRRLLSILFSILLIGGLLLIPGRVTSVGVNSSLSGSLSEGVFVIFGLSYGCLFFGVI